MLVINPTVVFIALFLSPVSEQDSEIVIFSDTSMHYETISDECHNVFLRDAFGKSVKDVELSVTCDEVSDSVLRSGDSEQFLFCPPEQARQCLLRFEGSAYYGASKIIFRQSRRNGSVDATDRIVKTLRIWLSLPFMLLFTVVLYFSLRFLFISRRLSKVPETLVKSVETPSNFVRVLHKNGEIASTLKLYHNEHLIYGSHSSEGIFFLPDLPRKMKLLLVISSKEGNYRRQLNTSRIALEICLPDLRERFKKEFLLLFEQNLQKEWGILSPTEMSALKAQGKSGELLKEIARVFEELYFKDSTCPENRRRFRELLLRYHIKN